MRKNVVILACFAGMVLGLAILLMSFASHHWPLVLGDVVAYWPPVIFGAASGDFLCLPWHMAPVYDPQGIGRLTYHGFFLQWLLRKLGCQSYEDVYLGVGGFGVLTVLLTSASVFLLWRKHGRGADLVSWAVLLLVPVAAAQQFLGVFSRQESLVSLGSALLALVWTLLPWGRLGAVLSGLLTGLCAVTSPVAGILLGTLGLALGTRFSIISWPRWLGLFAASASAACVAAIALLYPYSISDFIQGNLNHASRAVVLTHLPQHLNYWLQETRCFGLAPLWLAIGGALLSKAWPSRPGPSGLGLLHAGLVGVFLAACWYFGVRQPQRCYNLQGLVPLLLTGGAAWLLAVPPGGRPGPARGLLMTMILLAGLFCSTGMIRYAITFRYALLHGKDFDSGARLLQGCLARTSGVVQISAPLLALSTDKRIRVMTDERPLAEYYVMAQTYSGLSAAPQIHGYELVEDHFSHLVPRLLVSRSPRLQMATT